QVDLVLAVAGDAVVQDLELLVRALEDARPGLRRRDLAPVDERIAEHGDAQDSGRGLVRVLAQAPQPARVHVVDAVPEVRPRRPPELGVEHPERVRPVLEGPADARAEAGVALLRAEREPAEEEGPRAEDERRSELERAE